MKNCVLNFVKGKNNKLLVKTVFTCDLTFRIESPTNPDSEPKEIEKEHKEDDEKLRFHEQKGF